MPKDMIIDPHKFMAGDKIKFEDINCFEYKNSLKDEIDENNLTASDVKEIIFQMRLIRSFEKFLENWKLSGMVDGVNYHFPGPAHMAIGQEAAAVGQYFVCDENDFNFGTHRNHSETIAKAMSVIYKSDDDKLNNIMNSYFNKDLLNAIEKDMNYKSIKQKNRYYIIYGLIAEILNMKSGVNKGLGGSMHMFFTPFGIYPNNAVVGAGIAIAAGAALYKLEHQDDGVVVANIGDGGVSTGPFWESLHFASMDQYKTLWKEPYNKYPPLIVNVINNGYGMGGQTKGETMGYSEVARIASAFKPNKLHATRVDGNNVLSVIDVMRKSKDIVSSGDGPVLNEIVTYRISGHSSADAQPYRTREEILMWEQYDPITLFEKQALNINVVTDEDINNIQNEIDKMITEVFKLVQNNKTDNTIDMASDLEEITFSKVQSPSLNLKKLEMDSTYEQNPHIIRLNKKQRYGFDSNNNKYSKIQRYQIRDAIYESIFSHLYKNPSLIIYGEEHRFWEGAYGVYRDMTFSTPPHRFFNTPIAEAAIVGSAIGYAMCGGQAVVEIMYFDFLWRCGDEIANQLGKWTAMSGGELSFPVVIRFNIGYGYGAQHSQDLSAAVAHIPGIQIVSPVTPSDAKGLMSWALNQNNPVIFIEVQELYDYGEYFEPKGVSADEYEIQIGEPIIRKKGNDLTLITFGAQLYIALEASKEFEKYGINVEVIDIRSLVPLNYDLLINSVKKTGNVIIANNGIERNNIGKEIAANITRFAFTYLDSPPLVLGAKNTIMPGEDFVSNIYPTVNDYLSMYSQNIKQIKEYNDTINHKNLELIRRKKKGV